MNEKITVFGLVKIENARIVRAVYNDKTVVPDAYIDEWGIYDFEIFSGNLDRLELLDINFNKITEKLFCPDSKSLRYDFLKLEKGEPITNDGQCL